MNANEKKDGNLFKKLLIFFYFIAPVLVAVLVVGLLVRSRKAPEERPAEERTRAARFIPMAPTDVVPRAIGYGYVEPARVWQVVPEVSGKIINVNPKFKKGEIVKADEVLVKIDPKDYELAVLQREAEIEKIRADLAELDVLEENYKRSLTIERRSLSLKKTEMERHKRLLDKGAVSSSQYEQAQIAYYTQSSVVTNLTNSLKLIPSQRNALRANLALNQAKLNEANLDLTRTTITVPFDCRITSTSAEVGQFVPQGQAIASADGIAAAEISAQFPIQKMANLVRAADKEISEMALMRMNMDTIREAFGFQVTVRLAGGDLNAEWPARFARADATMDAKTRTLGIIVKVDEPYKQIKVGQRPPLARNMFCEVELRGRPIKGAMVIPRSALHDDVIYIANAENRLERRTVAINFSQTDFHVVKNGIVNGDRLIVSDLIPAVEGMLLELERDEDLGATLLAQAEGRTPVK